MEKGLMPAFLDLPCALLVTDPSGRTLALNDELLAVLGGTRAYWESAGLDAMLPPASRVFLQTHVWPMLDAGRVAPVMDSTFPLGDAAAAHRRVEDPGHIGKIVLALR